MLNKSRIYLKKIQLKNKQRVIDKQYAKEGLTGDVLEKQLEINRLRHELNIPDENNFVYENFVQ